MNHDYCTEFKFVKLRPLVENDIESLRILRNKNRSSFINKEEISTSKQKGWYENYLNDKSDYMFAIECPSLRFAGAIAIYNVDHIASCAEFGRIMVVETAPKYTGTYAISALLLFAQKELNLKTITCSVLKSNQRAITIYERIGFRRVRVDNLLSFYQIELETWRGGDI
jgi:RimJ/RimL family protein N-acetyltransferase